MNFSTHTHTHTHTRARTHARAHARTHAQGVGVRARRPSRLHVQRKVQRHKCPVRVRARACVRRVCACACACVLRVCLCMFVCGRPGRASPSRCRRWRARAATARRCRTGRHARSRRACTGRLAARWPQITRGCSRLGARWRAPGRMHAQQKRVLHAPHVMWLHPPALRTTIVE